MPSLTEWRVPPAYQPRPGDYSFDLDRALSAVVGLHSIIPADAFTAETLGTERAGNGVVIDDGLVLTIGYLITEAEAVWLHLGDGRVVEGHALGFDSVTGFGLVQALGRIDLDPLPFGSSAAANIGDRVVVGGAGGRTRSVASQIAARQEFAGYWEYLLDEAIFTYPAHPNWGGTGLISAARRIDRHRLAAARTRARGQGRARQHDRADRPAQAGDRRFAQIRPRQQAGASLARDVFDRDRQQGRGDRHLRQRARGARRAQGRRRHPGGEGRKDHQSERASTASSGRSGRPASTCRSRFTTKASPSTWCWPRPTAPGCSRRQGYTNQDYTNQGCTNQGCIEIQEEVPKEMQ